MNHFSLNCDLNIKLKQLKDKKRELYRRKYAANYR